VLGVPRRVGPRRLIGIEHLPAVLAAAVLLHVAAGLWLTRPLRSSPHLRAYVAKFGWFNVHVLPVLAYPTLNVAFALRRPATSPVSEVSVRYRHPGDPSAVRAGIYEGARATTPRFAVLTIGDEWVEMLGGDAARRRPGLLQFFDLVRDEDDDVWRGTPRPTLVATRGIRAFTVDLTDPAETVVTFEATDPASVRAFFGSFAPVVEEALPSVSVEVDG